MEIDEHITALRREGGLLSAAVDGLSPHAPVPSCPGWTVRDLLRHTGMVHRWARSYVADALTVPRVDNDTPDVGPLPADADLVGWFRNGHTLLVDTLASAPADLACWTFLPTPGSPLAFWARRQAHETTIHRIDAELAATGTCDGVGPTFAADGIDELIRGFLGRPGRTAPSGPPWSLSVVTADTHEQWYLQVRPDGRSTRHTTGNAAGDARPGDCRVRGTASDLYLALWNRISTNDLDVTGDRSVLERWRETIKITW